MNRPDPVAKGARLWWWPETHSPLRDRVFIEVTRVARDGSWADLRCCTWAVMWTKRQPLPLPEGTCGFYWTQRHLDLQEQDWNRERLRTAGGAEGAGEDDAPCRPDRDECTDQTPCPTCPRDKS